MEIHEGQKTKELSSTVRNVKSGPVKSGYSYRLTKEEHRAMKLMALDAGMSASDLLSLWIQEHREEDKQ